MSRTMGARSTRWALIGGVACLAVTGVVLLGLGVVGGDRALSGPAPSATAAHGTVRTVPSATPLAAVHSVPLRLRIPAIYRVLYPLLGLPASDAPTATPVP